MQKKWNLQDIRPATQQRPTQVRQPSSQPRTDISPRIQRPAPTEISQVSDIDTIDIIDGNKVKKKRAFFTALISLLIISGAYFFNILIGGATITIQPKVREITVQSEISAKKTPMAGELSYELLTLDASAEKQVQAKGKEEAKVPASGKIFVYNTNSSPQKLIANTRFESPDGLIFRIKESIEVPAASASAEDVIPGKIVVDVFADQVGEKYNIQPTRFTVPGLKGSPQFDAVYAESTTAFTGGFEGDRYIIDPTDLQTAQQELHVELRNILLTQIKEKVPAGFLLYDDAITFTFTSLPATEYGDTLATIKETATLHAPIFKENMFSQYLAELGVPEYNNEPVTLSDPKSLVFSYTDPQTSLLDISTLDSLDFTLRGNTKVIWQFDEQKLKNDLIGKRKTDSTQVLSNYKSIENANTVVRPFWATTFPDDIEEIEVITEMQ
ncbi:MAG TPA: hypothetical protein VFV22_01820 [Candidatus Paceibacterota bacterium]|nr:hypothetical protein [Candidatus Paceibacterota bacterium]